jgi:hypothetical protein
LCNSWYAVSRAAVQKDERERTKECFSEQWKTVFNGQWKIEIKSILLPLPAHCQLVHVLQKSQKPWNTPKRERMKDKAGRPINPLFSIPSQKVSYKNRKNRGTHGTRVETRGFLPPRRRNAATPPNQGGELKRSCKNRENRGTRLGRVLGRPGTHSPESSSLISGFSAANCSRDFESISPRKGRVPTFALKFPLSSYRRRYWAELRMIPWT